MYTSVDEFIEKYSNYESGKKLGFIFHMSRCGSTLVTQMLASNDRFFVLSEPTIINSVLDPALDIDQEKRSLLLRASVKALASCSPNTCEQVFIKFRSWNILYLDQILTKFPNVSWMFIHRHGLEVLQSVLEKPPGWLRSRKNYAQYFTNFIHVDASSINNINEDEYAIRMLGIFCAIAGNSDSRKKLFIDYDNLKNKFFDIARRLWSIVFSFEEINIMKSVSNLYSKDVNKMQKFKPDSKLKRTKATKIQEALVDRFVESKRAKLIS